MKPLDSKRKLVKPILDLKPLDPLVRNAIRGSSPKWGEGLGFTLSKTKSSKQSTSNKD